MAFANHAAYCASKAGLDALTRVLALGAHGIRNNSVKTNDRTTWENSRDDPLGSMPLEGTRADDAVDAAGTTGLSDSPGRRDQEAMRRGMSNPFPGSYRL